MVTYWEYMYTNTLALSKILLCVYMVYNTMCSYRLWDKGGERYNFRGAEYRANTKIRRSN